MILAFLTFLVLTWLLAGYLGVSQNLRMIYVFISLIVVLVTLLLIPETNSFSVSMGGWAPLATISFVLGGTFFFCFFRNRGSYEGKLLMKYFFASMIVVIFELAFETDKKSVSIESELVMS